MSLTITNQSSINVQRNLSSSQTKLSSAMERLSTGKRINSAKDDAAGMAIATRFTTQISGLSVAMRNANDGINMAQTAEGALDETTNNLQRIRDLAVQSASGTMSDDDRAALDAEVQQRIAEIDRVATQTTYNGKKILDGSAGTLKLQIGANVGETMDVDMSSAMTAVGLGMATGTGTTTNLDIKSATTAGTTITAVDAALKKVTTLRSNLGAVQNRLQSTVANQASMSANLSASRSSIVDADFAQETANMSSAQILQQAGVAVLAQANQSPQMVLKLLG